MGHAAVLLRGPASLPRDVRRDQPEHSLPLEAERASRSTARQEKSAATRRHDTAERAHHAGDRRPVLQRGDDQRPGAPVARHRGTRRPSQPGPPRREAGPAAGQHQGGHDVHDRLQHGPWPAGHAGAECTRGQDRRRLAGATLVGAHSPRHIGERLGHDDHDPAARGQSGRRAEPRDMASIHASEATLAAMKAAFPHVVLCFLPPRSTSYLQPCDVAVFRSFKNCIQTQASAPLARSVLEGFGRMGSSRSHGPLRREPGVDAHRDGDL